MTRNGSDYLRLCSSYLALGAALLLAMPAHAQTEAKTAKPKAPASQEGAGQDADGDKVETIVVTGTNISGVKPVGSAAIALDREDILASGKTNAADVVRTLPQVRDLGTFREGGTQGDVDNAQQGNAINLRGLGAAATLVLIDGRRVVATGAAATFTEANQVPMAALKRIEVIADGASAIYGSDAVAGVVNFVLRKDFDGVEAAYRISNASGATEMTPSVTVGSHWNLDGLGAGNIIASYEYSHRDPLLRGKNKFLRQDLRPVGGVDGRLSGATASIGVPGAIYVANQAANTTLPRAGNNTWYGLPASATGVGITASQLQLNQINLIDTADYTDYLGRLDRHQVSAFFNQDLGERVNVFASGAYSHRYTLSRVEQAPQTQTIQTVTVPAFLYNPLTNTPDPTRPNPAYISGIPGVAPGANITALYKFAPSTLTFNNKVENFNLTGGFNARLGGGWNAEAYYTYGRDKACNYCVPGMNVNTDALQFMINTGEINPFSTAPLTAAQLGRIFGDNVQESGNTFRDVVAKFDGPLFQLPGGAVRAAVGAEISRQTNWNLNSRNRGINNDQIVDTDKSSSIGRRTIKSAFGELYVPVIGEDMNLGVVRELAVSAAVRRDDYSDVGSTTNPKVGATLELGQKLTLRGSWGTSFRAPGLPDVNPSAFSGTVVIQLPNNNPNVANDFCLPAAFGGCFTTVGNVFGANPDVKPETATNWSFGGDFRPIDNLRLSATYYKVSYKDRIVEPGYLAILNYVNGYPDYAGLAHMVMPINNTNVTGPSTCTMDPVLVDYMNRPTLYGAAGFNSPCNIKVLMDARKTNLAATLQDGLDFQIDYTIPISGGAVTFNAAANKILRNLQQATPGAKFFDLMGRFDQPIEWRGRGSAGVYWKGLSSTLFVNYTGGYDNTAAVDPVTGTAVATQRVKPWTTFDLNLSYSPRLTSSFLKETRLSASIQNLTDKDPPLMVTSNSVFSGAYANPFGRTATVELSMRF